MILSDIYAQDQELEPQRAESADNADSSGIDERELGFSFSNTDNEAESQDNSGALGAQPFGLADLLRMVLVLALVVVMIYGVYFFLKRSRKIQEDESNFINILSSQTMPGGQALHIIDVAGRVYLLGASDSNIALICEITDTQTIDALRLHSQDQKLKPKSFAQLMGTFLQRNSPGAGQARSPRSMKTDEARLSNSNSAFAFINQQVGKVRQFEP